MLQPPPRSTLFPYTTLFRSEVRFRADDFRTVLVEDAAEKLSAGARPTWRSRSRKRASLRRKSNAGSTLDRKSTRLNSSHITISYAVFCLKKKKKIKKINIWL